MQKEQNVRLVLASASPRRRELLSQIGLEFTVMPSTKEENAKTTEAGALVQELSRQKAVDIWEQLSGGQGRILTQIRSKSLRKHRSRILTENGSRSCW